MIYLEFPYCINEKTNKFYFVGETPLCLFCKKILDNAMKVRILTFRRRNPIIQHICFKCLPTLEKDRYSKLAITEQIMNFLCVKRRPKGTKILEIKPPLLTISKSVDSVFEAASKNMAGEETIDKTKISGRESWQHTLIGDEKKLLE